MEKRKKKGHFFSNLLLLILLGIIVFSLYKAVPLLLEYYEGTKAYDKIAENTKVKDDSLDVDWKALKKQNKDVIAWIYSKGTVINYPVVQGEDNSYYLHRLLDGTYNFKGTLYVDYQVENPFEDFNTIIYGHRMKDGTMFKPLVKYRDEEGYYKKHKIMKLATPEKQYELQIFAAITVSATSDFYQCYFDADEEKEEYLEKIQEKNVLKSNIDVTADDCIVMMSTCTYEFDKARVVVYGKLVETGE